MILMLKDFAISREIKYEQMNLSEEQRKKTKALNSIFECMLLENLRAYNDTWNEWYKVSRNQSYTHSLVCLCNVKTEENIKKNDVERVHNFDFIVKDVKIGTAFLNIVCIIYSLSSSVNHSSVLNTTTPFNTLWRIQTTKMISHEISIITCATKKKKHAHCEHSTTA